MHKPSIPTRRWPLYLSEATELALFMISACAFTVLLFGKGHGMGQPHTWPIWFQGPLTLRAIMGVAMGLTALGIIHSPFGRLSGAHFNPAITLAYLRLGKIGPRDAFFYIVWQFAGGIAGVGLAALWLGQRLAAPEVQYAVTVPGNDGVAAAFAAEFFMAAVLMAVVLWTSNRPAAAPYTSYCVAVLIAVYVIVFAPISGFSINPARTFGSAVFAHRYTALWVYFTAPLLGTLSAAEVHFRLYGTHTLLTAELHHDPA